MSSTSLSCFSCIAAAAVYYTGPYCPRTSTFDLASSGHPHPLDLGGATFYAPNLLTNDPQGR